ncbi:MULTISPECIES: serine hydrolase [Psychrobacter]|jgi:D-alanyl-D-alanine endopeptidase (penicillin-binding protein 7)|uniref:serine hydrolase n=1 Tax=Psychrobacter TaxID=497 RepID=UPI000869218D|nr:MULTISPECIES: serine hydrolase [Psychrobacter]MBA6244476.1 serine hydrolase [Psychrobacter sp. Urea-trap-18]MBA6287024.1 serine hydrolase [Psychrobacter sp. Urea-trap-16]MBA6319267.1 serine hydrolase [Psychrobacter sp. Urea-trap-20]MBA6335557.1 serine hydrolase [Psychrobacter sp. Urea-trap-19]OEH67128.1 MAG: peptidase S11 [Psychrobacter sp. B29-1]|tara:strand:- start:15584 stop:16666 length:1083 start_codon:yes stop_codon:yes gene_type:complete
MKQLPLTKQQLIAAMISLSLGSVAQAALTINGSTDTASSARLSWGGADSLSEARNIMYKSNGSAIKKVDNGYGTTNITNTNSFASSNNTNSARYNTTYRGAFGSSDMIPISTDSRSVAVIDAETGESIYEKDADIARPMASITKVMTAMVVLDAGLDMREEITLDPEDFVGPKRASSRLKSGDRLNRAEMLLMALMKSENPAAKSLARNYPGGYDAFMRAMNRKAQDLGMNTAFFGDPTGLDKRNVASSKDLVKMVRAAGNYDVIRRFSTTKSYDFFVSNYSSGNRTYKANNTSSLVRAGDYPIGISKTGFINEAGRCVVMETRVNNRPAIIVILGANSSATRWGDAKNILNSLATRRTV